MGDISKPIMHAEYRKGSCCYTTVYTDIDFLRRNIHMIIISLRSSAYFLSHWRMLFLAPGVPPVVFGGCWPQSYTWLPNGLMNLVLLSKYREDLGKLVWFIILQDPWSMKCSFCYPSWLMLNHSLIVRFCRLVILQSNNCLFPTSWATSSSSGNISPIWGFWSLSSLQFFISHTLLFY